MNIIYKKSFETQLVHIVNYIAEDKVSAAIKFASELEELLFLIPDNPFNINNQYISTIKT